MLGDHLGDAAPISRHGGKDVGLLRQQRFVSPRLIDGQQTNRQPEACPDRDQAQGRA